MERVMVLWATQRPLRPTAWDTELYERLGVFPSIN